MQKLSKIGMSAACSAHPNPPFGYEGLKANTGFLVITFGALESFLEAGKTIEDYIATQRTPIQRLKVNADEMETPSVDPNPTTQTESLRTN
ncbi:hypothetical protein H6F96_19620 [Microcoleus sp. FACHB-53]|nr:hypothetical protein [Microcoleus sp. FACHB-53]